MTSPAAQRAALSDLERALDRASGSHSIPGNGVTHLPDGPATFAAMHRAIADATVAVSFENYIIRDDRTGRAFADAMAAAVERGVRVRVLYDDFGCRSTSWRYWRRLRQRGVEVRAYNPVSPFRLLRAARRNHRKYVGVDGIRAIVGGLCIGDEWSGDEALRRLPWRDTAVEVTGPVVAAIDETFRAVWAASRGEGSEPTAIGPAEDCGAAAVRVVNGVPGSTRTYRTIQLLAASAVERLWITDAYLLAPPSLVAALNDAARDGVDVRLLVPGKSDVPPVRAFTRVGYRELLEAGVRIWEWQGPMLHAKTVVVDRRLFKVGSSNLNATSFQNNYELDVLIDDASVTATAAAQYRADLRLATEVVLGAPGWMPGPLAQRLPPAVMQSGPVTRVPAHRPARRERSLQAVVALRQVAGGARRSIAGAVLFASLGAAALLIALPRLTAYMLALGCFWLAARAAWEFRQRRHGHRSRTRGERATPVS